MKKLSNLRIEVIMGVVAAVAVVAIAATYGGPNVAQAAGAIKDGATAIKAAAFGEDTKTAETTHYPLSRQRKDFNEARAKARLAADKPSDRETRGACPMSNGKLGSALKARLAKNAESGCDKDKDKDGDKGSSGIRSTGPTATLAANKLGESGCDKHKDKDGDKGSSGVQSTGPAAIFAELNLHECAQKTCPLNDIQARADAGKAAGLGCCATEAKTAKASSAGTTKVAQAE